MQDVLKVNDRLEPASIAAHLLLAGNEMSLDISGPDAVETFEKLPGQTYDDGIHKMKSFYLDKNILQEG